MRCALSSFLMSPRRLDPAQPRPSAPTFRAFWLRRLVFGNSFGSLERLLVLLANVLVSWDSAPPHAGSYESRPANGHTKRPSKFSRASWPAPPNLPRQLICAVGRRSRRHPRALAVATRSPADLCTNSLAGRLFRRETQGHRDGRLTGPC